ncbi:Gfo/Idh/MocA family oxidoreductase [Martelella sp. HB161492]|uniref:Gfo/Idh/MocA family protein n=1 Tax=Martelella sp. HB161492 TaxID=2720726 RepID=UPI001591BEE5|nr:Gfo/Idh/MocA family oxidoreductase [Martelella sp. HB161492]
MAPIQFGVVGSGWRAEFFLRAAKALPAHFSVAGIVTGRDAADRKALSDTWQTPVFATIDDLLTATKPAFAVLSVKREAIFARMAELAWANMPILAETPPAADLDGLKRVHDLVQAGAKIEVAEQYFLHPVLTAMRTLIGEGMIGTPSYAHVSIMQTYHGISMMRKLLGIGFENATVTATRVSLPVVKGPGRYEQPAQYEVIPADQTIATFDFGNRIGLYDFADSQHRSRIRAPRITVRGERGEITPERLDHLLDERTPLSLPLIRRDTGHFVNFEGYRHAGITAGDRWVYQNPFADVSMADDEIAVATCLLNMRRYVEDGISSYSFAEAAQDCHLANAMAQAAESGRPVTTTDQPWRF